MTNTQKMHLFHFKKSAEELRAQVKGEHNKRQSSPITTMQKYLDYLYATIKNAGKKDRKQRAYRRLMVVLRRTIRLLDLGAPQIIVENELRGLMWQIEEMRQVLDGVIPKLNYSDKQELIFQSRSELGINELPVRERVYIMNGYFLGYRLK
jgi:hypothetical protein